MKNDPFKCKICGGKVKAVCKCPRSDSFCEAGHEYHWSPYYKAFHLGQSDHSTDTMGPDCCKDKIAFMPAESKTPIESLMGKLSVRAYASLKYNDVNYIEDIKAMDFKAITSLKNISRRTVEELEELLEVTFE